MKLSDAIWDSPVLRQRLKAEAAFESRNGRPEKAQYCVFAPHNGGGRACNTLRNYKPEVLDIDPHEMQVAFAQELRWRLQKELHHDGIWLVGWTHPPSTHQAIMVEGDNCWSRMVILWLDEDADPQFCLDIDDTPFVEMIQRGGRYYLDMSERAWLEWSKDYGKRAIKDDFGLREDQTKKAVLSSIN